MELMNNTIKKWILCDLPEQVVADIEFDNNPDNAKFTSAKGMKAAPGTMGISAEKLLEQFKEE